MIENEENTKVRENQQLADSYVEAYQVFYRDMESMRLAALQQLEIRDKERTVYILLEMVNKGIFV